MTRRERAARLQREITAVDRRLLAAAARRRSPASDAVLTRLSNAANNGRLWLGIAAALSATGRRRPRTAAAGGLLGLGIASTLVNGPLKFVWQRERPTTDLLGGSAPLLPLPRTFSFPSGHAASALAFATGVSTTLPVAAPVVLPLAGGVAYSRVHTGVHYPSDVLVGAGFGVAAGLAGAAVVTAVRARSVHFADTPALPDPPPRRAVVLVSANSGSADGLEDALDALRSGGLSIDEQIDIADLPTLRNALDGADPPPLVVAAGGDGTVGAAAQAVQGHATVLGIIPLGTSNDAARSLGIPPDPREAAEVVLHGQVRAVDLGHLAVGDDSRVFVNAATIGLNVAFATLAATGRMREKFRGLTYPVAAAMALRRHEPFVCEVECDGHRTTYQVVHLSVSNATVFGGVLGMRVPGASIADGLLDVIVVERLSLARLAVAVGDTLVGRHKPVHRVHAMQVRSLRVTSSAAQQVAADGEVVGDLPVEFSIRPAALKVLTPRR